MEAKLDIPSQASSGLAPDGCSGKVFAAGQIADFLGLSGQAVRKRMRNEPARKLETKDGQTANGWALSVLPAEWQSTLSAMAARKGYRTPEAMLSDEAAAPWAPPVPLADVAERFQAEAIQWRNALLPVLPHQNGADPGELCQRGLAECRRVFGREISESTWRRHFDLAVERDRNFQQWGRVDIYLAEDAFQHVPAPENARAALTAEDTEALTDAFKQVANPSHPTVADRDAVFEALLKYGCQAPAATLDYTFGALPGLCRTRKALGKWFRRKRQQLRAKGSDLNLIKDGRPERSGRSAAKLCPECERIVAGATVDLDGDLAQVWRRLLLGNKLCQKCSGLWHYDVRKNKSYVPKAVRDQVMPQVLAALPFRHGVKHARLNAPYVLRKPDIGPGDVFEADDLTQNHMFYAWDTDEAGRPYVGRGEMLLFIDRRTQYPVGYLLKCGYVGPDGKQQSARYDGQDIRLGVLHVHDKVGLPHQGFLFENGTWRSRLVVGRKITGWRFNLWRDFERGLNAEGIVMAPRGQAVRHALPGNPRTKLVERVIRSLQERMRNLPAFVGFNHREYKPEVLNDFLRQVAHGKRNPAEMCCSMSQLRDVIDGELMAFAAEPQNGRWLPGVSPEEAWLNGFGGFPGMRAKPLRRLSDTTRYLLSTHWRELPVTEKGVRFEVGSKHLVFWGDQLIPWKFKSIPVRWNIEEPELLHCLPPGGAVFTLKHRELPACTATQEQLAEAGADRNRWIKNDKHLFDNMPHALTNTITRDTEHSAEVHAEGQAIARATEEYRTQKDAAGRDTKRLAALAGTLGMKLPRGNTVTPRAIAARQRRLARRDAPEEAEL